MPAACEGWYSLPDSNRDRMSRLSLDALPLRLAQGIATSDAAFALRASARQPPLTSLRKPLACRAVAGEASEGWCERRDLNPHSEELVSKTSASAVPPRSHKISPTSLAASPGTLRIPPQRGCATRSRRRSVVLSTGYDPVFPPYQSGVLPNERRERWGRRQGFRTRNLSFTKRLHFHCATPARRAVARKASEGDNASHFPSKRRMQN